MPDASSRALRSTRRIGPFPYGKSAALSAWRAGNSPQIPGEVKFQEESLKRFRIRLLSLKWGLSMHRCIVVADDDPTVVSLVKTRLAKAQYAVFAAADSEQALAMVQAKDPVAVILDVQMPGGGGLSVLSKLKADPKTSSLPVMMLTGERNAETVLQAMDAGADDYMVKPFLPDALMERVSRLVNKAGKVSAAPVWEI